MDVTTSLQSKMDDKYKSFKTLNTPTLLIVLHHSNKYFPFAKPLYTLC